MSVLFPKIPALLHGGDYNPDQWLDRPDILEEDIKMMKKAGVNTASVGVFSGLRQSRRKKNSWMAS